MEKVYPYTGDTVKTLYEAEFTVEPKDEDERRKQESIKNYMNYILNTEEFKEKVTQEILRYF